MCAPRADYVCLFPFSDLLQALLHACIEGRWRYIDDHGLKVCQEMTPPHAHRLNFSSLLFPSGRLHVDQIATPAFLRKHHWEIGVKANEMPADSKIAKVKVVSGVVPATALTFEVVSHC